MDDVTNKIYCFNGIITPTYEMVDLGLSVKWATCNLGASSPEEYGNFYAWGDTYGDEGLVDDNNKLIGKQYMWADYKWGTSASSLTKYNTTDGLTQLEDADDAVIALGGNYRMPTLAECQELKALTNTITTLNGVKGVQFTGTNGNKLFIPLAGYLGTGTYAYKKGKFRIWTSTRCGEYNSSQAFEMDGGDYSGYVYTSQFDRCCGLSIRPVCE